MKQLFKIIVKVSTSFFSKMTPIFKHQSARKIVYANAIDINNFVRIESDDEDRCDSCRLVIGVYGVTDTDYGTSIFTVVCREGFIF